ncbi:MAG: hypothetical protein C0631_19075 [Sedimenticola sp.]|nr:MAG: hypothetical protein C0631_19075 [Sedimenticola sp.]
MLGPNMPLVHNVYYDLRNSSIPSMLGMMLQTAISPGNKVIHIAGDPHGENAILVEIDVGCHDLFWQSMENTKRAIGTALFTALLVSISFYGFLQIAVVRRLQRLTSIILDFRRAPADASRSNICSGRVDEIGIAEEAFRQIQNDIRAALIYRTRLAAIGMAVTKIQHDLRGTLSSVMLASDTLETSSDPEVQRILPGLLAAIDRSVELCRSSMSFAQDGVLDLNPHRFLLSTLIDELFKECHVKPPYELINQVSQELHVVADRVQLYRAVSNLIRNALEAGADQVIVSTFIKEDMLELDVADNGPGISGKIISRLFTPFMSSTKFGSSGLGLSIAREIAMVHGGDVNLVVSGPGRTVFCIRLPLPIDY